MLTVILLATAWGSKYGGINTFNHSFTVGLRRHLGPEGRIICAVPNATTEDIDGARKHNVELFNISDASGNEDFDPNWVGELRNLVPAHDDRQNIIWVGHDVKSGLAARKASEEIGGHAALIMHMDYLAYQGLIHDGEAAWEKHEQQVRLFQGSASAFAVGPLLQRSCDRLTGSKRAHRLVPGFPMADLKVNKSPDDLVAGIMLGRVDAEHDRLKQGQLTVAAFSAAVARDRDWRGRTPLSDGHLTILGLDEDPATRKALFENSEKHAQQLVNVLPSRYTEDRDLAIDRIRRSNLAFMLSWHEGFGLVGWEAIACEVPLIVTVNSGLYELIDGELGGAGIGCIHGVRIEGSRQEGQNFSGEDVTNISKLIYRISSNIGRAKSDAQNLKRMLLKKLVCTWEETARQFLDGIAKDEPGGTSLPSGGLSCEKPPEAPAELDQAESTEARNGSVEPTAGNVDYLGSLSHYAKQEVIWVLGTGPDAELDKVIQAFKSYNWYTQNPAVQATRRLLLQKPEADASQVFLLGRNIYQAADGSANDAISFLNNLRTELARFSVAARRFLFLGMLYEVYFSARDEVRSIPKASHVDALFNVATEDDLKEVADQLYKHLVRVKPNRYPVLPGQPHRDLKLVLATRRLEDELSPLILEDLTLNEFALIRRPLDQEIEVGWGQLRKYGIVIQVDDLLKIVQDYFAIPRRMLSPNIDKKVTIAIDDDISLIE